MQPGDIIAWADNAKDASSTGHIMLIAAVSSGGDIATSRDVVVIDETGSPYHTSDTRSNGSPGIGMGYARLAVSPHGDLQFFWGVTDPDHQPGAIALGRALG